ncbi:MAG: PrsW family intramembrane metalloprotease [Candidatus Micrarchaeota archaeon]|nr:PrsW family intramembrane metalloprotease [Candidatus Micrarchaeota archaeon]
MQKTLFFLAFALLSSQVIFADDLANQLADFSNGLDADLSIQNSTFLKSPQIIIVDAEIRNPNDEPMSVYLIRQEADGWKFVNLLGAIAPNAKNSIGLEISAQYDKKTVAKTRYAIVGRGADGTVYGTFFEISENWEEYEKAVRSSLTSMVLIWVPSVTLVLIVLLFAVARYAYRTKSPESVKGEYTMQTLIVPNAMDRPFEEKVADLIMHPVTLVFELACVGVLVWIMLQSLTQATGADDAVKIMLLSAVGSFAIPFVYFAAAWYFEKREEGKPLRFFAGMFVWGMFAAFLSLLVSSGVISELRGVDIAPYVIVATMLVSPVVEETFKGIGILFMSGHHDYNDALTGLLLGFTCGAGFAFVENWFYFSFKTNPFDIGFVSWATLILYRSFFNTLAHGCFTAAISTPIGYARSIRHLRSVARMAFVPCVFLAIAIHSIYNMSALADSFVVGGKVVPFYVFNPMLIILLATMFFLVLVFAVIDEKKRLAVARLNAAAPS